MHSVIDSFNCMSVIDYSKVVYKIGNVKNDKYVFQICNSAHNK